MVMRMDKIYDKIKVGIIAQAVADIQDRKPFYMGDAFRFLRSDWGAGVCDDIGLNADVVYEKMKKEVLFSGTV